MRHIEGFVDGGVEHASVQRARPGIDAQGELSEGERAKHPEAGVRRRHAERGVFSVDGDVHLMSDAGFVQRASGGDAVVLVGLPVPEPTFFGDRLVVAVHIDVKPVHALAHLDGGEADHGPWLGEDNAHGLGRRRRGVAGGVVRQRDAFAQRQVQVVSLGQAEVGAREHEVDDVGGVPRFNDGPQHALAAAEVDVLRHVLGVYWA